MESFVSRVLRECGTTNRPFRLLYGFSKGTITYAVAGTYPDLSERLVAALCDLAEDKNVDMRSIYREYGATDIHGAYHAWQRAERKGQEKHLKSVAPPFRSTPGYSPVHFWVQDLYGSTETLAKALKVPAITVHRWAEGFTKGMPAIVHQVLTDLNYPYLDELSEAQNLWVHEFDEE